VSPTVELRGDRVVLEPLRVQHAAEMVDVLSDAALYRYTGGSPPSAAELEARYVRQVAGSGDPAQEWHSWVVRLGDDGPATGYVQATVGPEQATAELAWVVGTAWQGRGLAREAAAVVLAHLVASGVGRVVAHVHPDHVASQRVAWSLGLEPTSVLVDGEVEWVLTPGADRLRERTGGTGSVPAHTRAVEQLPGQRRER
jgi:RimJ/RimL family protein N-acetyltransferase